MTVRRLALIVLLLLAIVGALLFWTRSPETSARHQPEKAAPATPVSPLKGQSSSNVPTPPTAPFDPADFPIAAPLNTPDSTIARDLDILQQLFAAWRTNFPREGNPVGENADITAALLGDNRLGLALVPKSHPAVNARGELCDRWGTPFRFHQLGGERMEIRSAGPDRKFATADDVLWTPP